MLPASFQGLNKHAWRVTLIKMFGFISSPLRQEDGMGLFRQRPLPASEDVTSDEERMVICEEEGDDDVMGEQDDWQPGQAAFSETVSQPQFWLPETINAS